MSSAYDHKTGVYAKEESARFEVVPFDKEQHYPILSKWWGIYYGGPVPEKVVPKHGAAITYRGKLVATCFLYINDSKICHMDFCIVDPAMGAGRRTFFLRHVIEAGIARAKELVGDDVTIWSLTDHAVVGRAYQEKGFRCLGEGDCFAYSEDENVLEFLF